MSPSTRRLLGLLLTAAAAGGCISSTDPLDTIPSAVIRSEIEIAPTQVAVGSPVSLRVTSTNSGDRLVSARSGCAPGLGFHIKGPDGTVIDPYAGLAWICPRLDSQDLEPGETDTVSWDWTPQAAGRYEVVGGLLVDGKIVGPSAVRVFQAR